MAMYGKINESLPGESFEDFFSKFWKVRPGLGAVVSRESSSCLLIFFWGC